jgi:hypothetical protein
VFPGLGLKDQVLAPPACKLVPVVGEPQQLCWPLSCWDRTWSSPWWQELGWQGRLIIQDLFWDMPECGRELSLTQEGAEPDAPPEASTSLLQPPLPWSPGASKGKAGQLVLFSC